MKQELSIAALCVFLAACTTIAESTGNNQPVGSGVGAGTTGSGSPFPPGGSMHPF